MNIEVAVYGKCFGGQARHGGLHLLPSLGRFCSWICANRKPVRVDCTSLLASQLGDFGGEW
jgi:hypothetical protein